MRSAVALITRRYAFGQLRPLLPNQFASAVRDRGVFLNEDTLEALHRVGVLRPLLRVQRDGRAIAATARRNREDAWHYAHWQPTSADDLLEAHREGRLHDPTREGFVARRRLVRTIDDWTYHSSVFLYSQHQLIALPLIRQIVRHLRYQWLNEAVVGDFDAGVDARDVSRWRTEGARAHELAVAVTALDPRLPARRRCRDRARARTARSRQPLHELARRRQAPRRQPPTHLRAQRREIRLGRGSLTLKTLRGDVSAAKL